MIRQLRAGIILLAVSALLAAAEKPDFSGVWKMNPGKSDYGQVPKPEKLIRKIEHREPKLHMVSTQSGPRGEVTVEYNLTIDGSEQVNKAGNAEVRSRPRWEGAVLCIDTRRPLQDGELILRDRWTLSADGRTLTVQTHVAAPMGEADITAVFDKQ